MYAPAARTREERKREKIDDDDRIGGSSAALPFRYFDP